MIQKSLCSYSEKIVFLCDNSAAVFLDLKNPSYIYIMLYFKPDLLERQGNKVRSAFSLAMLSLEKTARSEK